MIYIGQSTVKLIKIMHYVIHIRMFLSFRLILMPQDYRLSQLFVVEIVFRYNRKKKKISHLYLDFIFLFSKVLSWYSRETCATITRSSQPLIGINRKCQDDNEYLNDIVNTNPNPNIKLFILDARPKMNALVNKPNGGGYENYSDCELEFQNIANIHVMRESLHKLHSTIRHASQDEKLWLNDLDNSNWLTHIRV